MYVSPSADDIGAADLEEMRNWLADCAEFGHFDPGHNFQHDIDPDLLEDHEVVAQVERAYFGRQGTNGVAGFIADGIKPTDREATLAPHITETGIEEDVEAAYGYQQGDLLQLLDEDGNDHGWSR